MEQLRKELAAAARVQHVKMQELHRAEVIELQRQSVDEAIDLVAAKARPSPTPPRRHLQRARCVRDTACAACR